MGDAPTHQLKVLSTHLTGQALGNYNICFKETTKDKRTTLSLYPPSFSPPSYDSPKASGGVNYQRPPHAVHHVGVAAGCDGV